jgi:hypothetical protein
MNPLHIANVLHSDLMKIISPRDEFFNVPYTYYNIKVTGDNTTDFYLRVEVNCEEGLGKMWLVESNPEADVKRMEVILSGNVEEAKRQQRQFWSYCSTLRQ